MPIETSQLIAIVMFALSLTIYEIFAKIKLNKIQFFTLKMKVKAKEEKGTCVVRLEMFGSDIF